MYDVKGGRIIFFGARVLKTGIAVTLAVLICEFFQIHPAIFSAISVVVNMQPSVSKSLKNAVEQVAVHFLGVFIAIALGFLFGSNPVTIGLAVIILIGICIKVKRSGSINLGVVSIIFVLDSPTDQFFSHVFIRSLAVLIGLGTALFINTIVFPPKNKERLKTGLTEFFQQSSQYFLTSLNTYINSHNLATYENKEPIELKEKINEIHELLENAREELNSKDMPAYIERFYELARGFVERGQKIDEMTALRVHRRNTQIASNIPKELSPEFEKILDLLKRGEGIITDLRDKLLISFVEEKDLGYFPVDEDYWESLSQVIDLWQDKFTGVYYMRSLMEVSVVATELSWGARRMKALLNIRHDKEANKKVKLAQ